MNLSNTAEQAGRHLKALGTLLRGGSPGSPHVSCGFRSEWRGLPAGAAQLAAAGMAVGARRRLCLLLPFGRALRGRGQAFRRSLGAFSVTECHFKAF